MLLIIYNDEERVVCHTLEIFFEYCKKIKQAWTKDRILFSPVHDENINFLECTSLKGNRPAT